MRVADLAVIGDPDDDAIPMITLANLLRGQPVAVLAPHPDDESLGCGCLLAAAFATAGVGARIVCLTDGSASHPGSRAVSPEHLAAIRRAELEAAVAELGGTSADITWIGAPDGALVADDATLAAVTDAVGRSGAGLVLAPSPLDPHCDHVAGAEIGRRLAVALPGVRLGFYPIWSRWHGGGEAPIPPGTRPVRLASAARQRRKVAAIAAHRSQQRHIVTDDPEGFEMPPGFAAFFAARDEIFFLAEPEVAP